ncbi:ABC transporter substrate-binding protein [Flindersiella endophytica]
MEKREKTGKPTTLSVSGFGADDEIAQIRLDLAKRELGITPKLNKGAFDEQQFLSAVAAGDPPDVVNMGRVVASYAARGALEPLDTCVTDAGIDLKQYREQAMAPLAYDGKTYGIPEFYNYSLLLVNNRVAKQAGIDPASIDTGNWPQLLKQAKAMTRVEGGKLVRLGFDPALPDSTLVWAAAHGVQPMADDGLTTRLDDTGMTNVFADIKQLADVQGGWTKVKSFKDGWDCAYPAPVGGKPPTTHPTPSSAPRTRS